MVWTVVFHDAFEAEFDVFPEPVQVELLARARVLEAFGPEARRPHVGTLKGSKHTNMKELRFEVDNGVWRTAFAFDPVRRAVPKRPPTQRRIAHGGSRLASPWSLSCESGVPDRNGRPTMFL